MQILKYSIALFFFILSFNAAILPAEITAPELMLEEQIIIVASSQEEPLRETPVITSVITGEEIRKMGARDINDVLLTVPGFSNIQDHNEYYSAERGIYASAQQKILVLRDGHRLNSRSYSEANFDASISLENVKRIEVLRGPGASLYGDVALTAVINIVTKDGNDIEGARASIGVGDFGQRKLDLVGGKEIGSKESIMYFASLYESTGQKVAWVDPRSPNVTGTGIVYGFRDRPLYDLGLKYKKENTEVSVSKRYSRYIEPASGSSITGEIYNINDYHKFVGETPGLSSSFTHAELKQTLDLGNWTLTVKPYYDDFRLAAHLVINPAIKKHGYLEWYEWSGGLQLQLSQTYSFAGEGTFLIGSAVDYMRLYDSNFKAGDDTAGYTESAAKALAFGHETIYSSYTQMKHKFNEKLIANVGARYDYKEKKEAPEVTNAQQISPRVALIYSPVPELDLRGNYAHSFVDAPYWYRYNTFPAYQGAASLKPEKLDSYQFSMTNYLAKGLDQQINFFLNNATDVIFRNAGGLYTNAGEIKTEGIEYEIARKRELLSWRLNYTYQDTFRMRGYEAQSDMLENIPRHIGNLIVDIIPLANWNKDLGMNFQVRYVGHQFARWGKSLPNPKNDVAAAIITNAGIYYNNVFKSKVDFSFHVYNLSQETYYQGGSVEYPFRQPGRSFLAQLSLKL